LPESDEEFQARLAAKFRDPEMFHREMLYLSRDRFDILRAELWELTQAFLDARRRKVFYQNTAFCFHHNRALRGEFGRRRAGRLRLRRGGQRLRERRGR
jgi:hypothetical protein